MAQVLEVFEDHLEGPLKQAGLNGEIQNFKGLVRARMNALATDAVDIYSLGSEESQNAIGIDLRDKLT